MRFIPEESKIKLDHEEKAELEDLGFFERNQGKLGTLTYTNEYCRYPYTLKIVEGMEDDIYSALLNLGEINGWALNMNNGDWEITGDRTPHAEVKPEEPEHYYRYGISVNGDILPIMYEFFDDDITPIESFYIGNIVKYLMRYKFKNGKDDLDKLITYVEFLKQEL